MTQIVRWGFQSEPFDIPRERRQDPNVLRRQLVFGSDDRDLVAKWAERFGAYVIGGPRFADGGYWWITRIQKTHLDKVAA